MIEGGLGAAPWPWGAWFYSFKRERKKGTAGKRRFILGFVMLPIVRWLGKVV